MRIFIILNIFFTLLFFAACKNGKENQTDKTVSYYTCPMHPSVVSSKPGSCPVCNMSLIKVEKTEAKHKDKKGNFITLDKQKQILAGIKTDTAKIRNINSGLGFLGTVTIDEAQVKTISSRAKGRIDKLFIKSTGIYLKSVSPLYSIYSEQLLADEKEYLSLYKKNNSSGFAAEMLNAAKNKLLLWGLSKNQISQLEISGKTSPLITFYSTESSYVSEVNITEGMYVDEGSPIIKITSLQNVWVEAQLYSNELSNIAENKFFSVFSENNPDEIYNGVLVYNNPIIEENKRIHLLKIRVENSKGNLIPGMMVSVSPHVNSKPVLAIPKSAVLLEKMKTVWVLAHENTFEQRMVQTGQESNNLVEIISGIKQGEIIVTEGAYLINSEFVLKSGAGQRHEH